MQLVLTPELMLDVYRQGIFPMAYSGDSPYVHWICPDMRGQLPIAEFHISRTLHRQIKKALAANSPFRLTNDTAFLDVVMACARPASHRPQTWINQPIIDVFCELHRQGHAHSVELWEGERLIGGVYGLALGGAFFAESMFSAESGASKIALCALAARLWKAGFQILDTQFSNEHLKQFGVYEIPHAVFKAQLEKALHKNPVWSCGNADDKELLAAFAARVLRP